MTQAPLALYPRTPASQRPDVAEQAIAFGLDLLVVDRQLVDDVGVVVQQGLAFGLLDPELDERVLKFAHPRLELLHRWRVTADGLGAGLELLGEVAVLVGQQPPLHACLRGELDHGQLAGRPQRCSRQQPVGGCLDGGPLRVEIRAGHPFSCWPSGGGCGRVWSCSSMIVRSRWSSWCSRWRRDWGLSGSAASSASWTARLRSWSMSWSVRAMFWQPGWQSVRSGVRRASSLAGLRRHLALAGSNTQVMPLAG